MDAIVIKKVTPLFGQSDIRGASTARLESIQSDLTEQLNLAGTVMHRAAEARPWPLIGEFAYRIDQRIANLKAGLTAEEERLVASFLKSEIEPSFDELRSIGPGVSHAIDRYNQALDPTIRAVYRKRRDFETSVALLNDHLSAYLDRMQSDAQRTFPHYFEKNQTDGIDYVIYLGASMHPERKLNPFHLKNLVLWQLEVACGLARHTRQIQPDLKIPLNTCHLILVNHTPLSIRFRYDEKRFDVDGAYDVRHEIVKSRLDKARLKNGRERLTQPDRIAVVYTHPKEGREMRRHIEFLQSHGQLLNDLEVIDLEDLPGVSGLKALRIGVNLEAGVARDLEQKTG